MNVGSLKRWISSRRRVELFLSIYAVGLLLSSYYPLVLTVRDTRLLRPDWVLFVPLFAYVTYLSVTSRRLASLGARGSYLAIGVLVVFGVSAVVNQLYAPFDAFTVLGQLLYVVTLFCCTAYLRIDRRTLQTVFQVWIGLMAIVSLYVVYQAVALNHGLPFWNAYLGSVEFSSRTMFETHRYSRPSGLFAEPRWLSGFYLPGIAFLIGIRTSDSDLFGSRRIDLAVLGIVLLAFALTGSMSGYLSLTALLTFGVLLPWTRRRTFKIAVGFYAMMAVLVAVLSVFGSGFSTMIVARASRILDLVLKMGSKLNNIVTLDGGWIDSRTSSGTLTPQSEKTASGIASHLNPGSIGIRVARAMTGVKAWFTSPLLGIGPGQFSHWAIAHEATEKFPVYFPSGLIELNNFWLQSLVTGGLFGFTAVGAVWAEIMNKLRHAFQCDIGESEYLPACVLVLFVLFTDGVWGIGIVHPLRWFFPAVVYSYVLEVSNERRQR